MDNNQFGFSGGAVVAHKTVDYRFVQSHTARLLCARLQNTTDRLNAM